MQTNTEIIKKIKLAGNSVQIQHFRLSKKSNAFFPMSYFRISKTQNTDISSKGGISMISVKTKNGTVYSNLAKCRNDEAFCYRKGTSICLARVVRELELDNNI